MATLTAILTALNELAPVFVHLFNLWREARLKGWINDGRALREKLKEADSDEKRMALARALFEHRAT